MQSGAIRDHQIIASSEKDNSSRVRFARLHYEYNKKPMSWVPLLDHRNQWLQVYLGNELTWVTGVATQGKQGKRKAWVKKFMLRYGELEYECSIKRAMGISTPRWVK